MRFSVRLTGTWKRANEAQKQKVLDVLKVEGWITVTRISTATGISRAICTRLVKELLLENRIVKFNKYYNDKKI